LRVEAEWGTEPDDDLARELEQAIRSRLSVRAAVTLVPPGSLERTEAKSKLTRTVGE
jgi:phenylacetate-CoA ligase